MEKLKSFFNFNGSYRERVSTTVTWGHWFAFFNILFAMLIGVQFIVASPQPGSFFGNVYLYISWFGHFSFLVFALYILILFPLTFLIPSAKSFRIVAVLLTTIGYTLLMLDAQAYQELNLHLNPVVWELLLSSDNSPLTAKWQYLFVIVPIILVIQILLSEWVWKKQRRLGHKRIGKPAAIFFFLCFIVSHLIYVWADAYFYRPITVQQANFPLSYPMTAKSFMEKHGVLDQQDSLERQDKETANTPKIDYPKDNLVFSGRGKSYNIMIVMVNHLRADMLNKEVMPNTFEFAQDNQWFKNHYSASNDAYGVLGLFYGLSSSYLPSIKNHFVPPLMLTLADQKNYQIATFGNTTQADPELHQAIIQKFNIEYAQKSTPKIISDWQSWLASTSDKPWFSYIEIGDIERYEDIKRPLPFFKTNSTSPKEKLKANYKTAVYNADKSLFELMETLKDSGQFDNTVVIITSNHGYEFEESGSWGYGSNFSRYQLQVPMVVHWPNKEAAQYDYLTSHLDISSTILKDLFDVSNPSYDLGSGALLFQESNRSWILAANQKNIALINNEYTTLLDKTGNYKIYDKNYRRDRDTKPKLSVILQGLSELKRFHQNRD